MNIGEMLRRVKCSLDTWAEPEGGSVSVAIDSAHMWELGAIDQESPRVILSFTEQRPRVDDPRVQDVLNRVDNFFEAMVTRGRGYEERVGDALVGLADGAPARMARPLHDLVEEAVATIQACTIDDVDVEMPIWYRGTERVPYNPHEPIYGYIITFSIGTQKADLKNQRANG